MAKKVIRVLHAIDAAVTHHAAKEVALSVGFNEVDGEEIAIAVSELASNQIKHAQGGTIAIEALNEEPAGIQVEAVDTGPGIEDVEKALADGFSTAGGLGLGLGSVNRLMDQVDIQSEPGQGTRILCRRWLRPKTAAVALSPLDIGVATRPLLGMSVNGDAFVVKQWQDHALIGIIDGLGHGQPANQAAETARQYVETHVDQPLNAIFRGTARACLATRGVVMALARFDFGLPNPGSDGAAPEVNFTFASLGNIEVRLLGSHEPDYFPVRWGVVGPPVSPMAIVTHHHWTAGSILILHSDGLTTHWNPADFPNLSAATAAGAAQELLGSLAKEEDDATVIVVKSGRKDRIR